MLDQAATGLVGGVKDLGIGVGQLLNMGVGAAVKHNPISQSMQRGMTGGASLADLNAMILAKDIQLGNVCSGSVWEGAKKLGSAIAEPVVHEWNQGRPIGAAVRVVAEVATVVGTGGAGGAAKGGVTVAGAATRAGGKVASEAAGELATAGGRVAGEVAAETATGAARAEAKVAAEAATEAAPTIGVRIKAKKPLTKEEQLKANKKNGEDFANKKTDDFKSDADKVEKEITIKAEDGTKTRVDAIGVDKETGAIRIQEYKASDTAPLTPNQTIAGPQIAETGGIVVGKGKGEFPGGTVIPPTKIEIVRPPKP